MTSKHNHSIHISIIANEACKEFGRPLAPGGKPFLNFSVRERFAQNVIKALKQCGYSITKDVN
jgi:hypothetical protein